MTNVNETLNHSAVLGDRLTGIFAGLLRRIADYREYQRTLSELQGLNERELNDLGLSRADIGRIAREAVYGH